MADSKNAFAAIAKDPHASWNINRKTVLNTISKSTAVEFKNNVLKKYTDKDLKQKKSRAYDAVIGDIKSALNLPKEPAREDFIRATKKIEEVQKVLEDALKEKDVVLDRVLIDQLLDFVQLAATALDEGTPFLGTAAFKTVKDKAKATGTNIASGLVSQLTQGIPFAPEMINFAGAKIKSALGGGGASSSAKEMASLLKGASDDGGNGDAEDFGGAIDTVEKAKEEILGGTSTGGGAAGGGLEFTNELLISIEDHLDFIRKNTETAETRREDKRKKDAQQIAAIKKMGGAGAAGLAGAGAAGAAAEGLDWMDLLIFDRAKSFFDKKGLIPKFFGGGAGKAPFPGGPGFGGVKPTLGKGVLSRLAIVPHLARLGPLLLNPWVLGAVAVGGLAWWLLSGDDDDEKPPARKKTKSKTPTTNAWGESISRKGLPEHEEGVTDVKETHIAKIHKGETVLDNKAAKDFKTGLETLKYLQQNLGVQLMPLVEIMGHSVEELKKQGYKGTLVVPDRSQEALIDLGYIGDTWEDSKWAKGLDELFEHFIQVDTETAFHRIAGVKSFQESILQPRIEAMSEAQNKKPMSEKVRKSFEKGGIGGLGHVGAKADSLAEALYALGLDWQASEKRITKTGEGFASDGLLQKGGQFLPGLSIRKEGTHKVDLFGRTENPLHKVRQTMENMSVSQLVQLQGSVKKYMLLREALQIANGTLEAAYSIWGAGDIVTGPDKDIFRTEFRQHDQPNRGIGMSSWNKLIAKGTGLGMVERIRPLLAAASAEVQNLVGGKAFYKPTDQSVYDARNRISGKYGMGVAKGGLGLLHKGEEVLEAAEVAAIGAALNNAAKNRIGIDRSGGGGSPNVIDTSSTQVVNNTTIIPPIEPNGPALPFGYANARV